MLENKPLVSIFMATYNHAAYIGQALDSCLKQETTFDFEIVVCDDCSNDGTSEIIREYAKKYPQVVPSIQPVNTKATKNFMDGLNKLRGKYVAFCEGDDFWTDTNKLQKQISFLEENPDFTVCCHKVKMLDMGKGDDQDDVFIYKDMRFDEERIKDGIFYADEAISNYFFQTSSVVFRWRFTEGLPSWFSLNMLLDHFLFMLHAVEGKIKYFDEDMSVWRRHPGGYSWLQTINKGLFFQKKATDWIIIYEEMDRFFSYRFTLQIRERILLVLRHLCDHYLQTGQLSAIKKTYEKFIKYFEKPVLENAAMLDALRMAMPEERKFYPPWAKAHERNEQNSEQKLKSVGGFYGLDIASIPETKNSVWDKWVGNNEVATFQNSVQAIIAFLWMHGCRNIWAPSFIYSHLQEIKTKIPLVFKTYPVNQNFEVLTDFIDLVQEGETVLTVSNFGKTQNKNLEKKLSQRKNIRWLEDRSQCLWTKKASKADAVIYNPTELLGIADGAILVGKNVASAQPQISATSSDLFFEKLKLSIDRMEDNSIDAKTMLKYRSILQKEHLTKEAASKLSVEMLKRIPLMPLVEKRIRNWQYLRKHFAQYSYWKEEKITFAPFAFLIEIPTSRTANLPINVLITLLENQNIFLPKSSFDAREDHLFSFCPQVLALPCDQRMEIEDLDRMITIINDYMAGKIEASKVASWQ